MPALDRHDEGGVPTERRAAYRDRYGVAVLLVVLTMIILAISGTSTGGRLLALVVEGCTLLFILWTSAVRQRTFVVALVLVAGAIIVACIAVIRGENIGDAGTNLIGVLLALFAPVAIVRRLLAGLRITASTVLGALCVYLLAGLMFAYLFALIDTTDKGQFFVQVTHPPFVDYLYFSMVTLTTLGYGDFTARASLGKMLAVTEALGGQLYLVSVVAVLVSNIGRERTPRQTDKHAETSNTDGAG
jgi:hypothetical protein